MGRRKLLRGAGVALALPWLEALSPRTARGQAAALPRRFLPIFLPCGVPSFWWPQAEGSGDAWQLTSVLEPLTPLKQHVTLLNHLENGSVFNLDDSPSVEPAHGRLGGAFLSCVDSDRLCQDLSQQTGSQVLEANGVSADQVLARAHTGETAIGSLQLGLATLRSYCDGRACSLSRSISWATQTKPLYKEIDPKIVFDLLFGTPEGPGPSHTRRDKSVLDAVLESSKALDGTLSMKDRQILDQYLTSIRDTEQRILDMSVCETAPPRPQLVVHEGIRNGQEGYDRNLHCDLMNQLIALAFQCDQTRVISYMLEDERSEFVYDHLQVRKFTPTSSTPGTPGVTCGELHGSGQSGPEETGVWDTITWWHTLKVSELCQKLASLSEGEGTVLDNTVVLYGSGMHGANHSAVDLPVALIGGDSMLKGDRFLSLGARTPLRDVYYTLLNGCFGLNVASFGESRLGVPHRFLSELLT